MPCTVLDPDEFPTTMNISLEGPWFSKEFSKQSMIHPSFWSHSVANPWNIIFLASNGIVAIQICEYEHGGFDH